MNSLSLVNSEVLVGIVGLFNINASPSVAFQSALTLTLAPSAIPAYLLFSSVV